MKPVALWLTGPPAVGKTTIGRLVADRLRHAGMRPLVLDGDEVRAALWAGLSLSGADRDANVRGIAALGELALDSGQSPIVSCVSPREAARAEAVQRLDALLVRLGAPVSELIARDPKGLYAKAQRGELKGLTGYHAEAPFEEPVGDHLSYDTSRIGPNALAAYLTDLLIAGAQAEER